MGSEEVLGPEVTLGFAGQWSCEEGCPLLGASAPLSPPWGRLRRRPSGRPEGSRGPTGGVYSHAVTEA